MERHTRMKMITEHDLINRMAEAAYGAGQTAWDDLPANRKCAFRSEMARVLAVVRAHDGVNPAKRVRCRS